MPSNDWRLWLWPRVFALGLVFSASLGAAACADDHGVPSSGVGLGQ